MMETMMMVIGRKNYLIKLKRMRRMFWSKNERWKESRVRSMITKIEGNIEALQILILLQIDSQNLFNHLRVTDRPLIVLTEI